MLSRAFDFMLPQDFYFCERGVILKCHEILTSLLYWCYWAK